MIGFSKILYSFLSKSDRFFFTLLFFLIIITAVIELMGVGSLFPYIKMLGDPKVIHENHFLREVYEFFHFTSDNHFLIFVGSLIFAMILVKGLITCFNNYYQARFTYGLSNRLSSFFLRSYIQMPYSEAISTNSAFLSKHLLVDVAGVIGVISAILTLLTDVTVSIALIGLMILADPQLVLMVVGTLLTLLWLTVKLTKNKTHHIAKETEKSNRYVYKTAAEAFWGLKDIKIHHVENYFTQRYLKWQHQLSDQQITLSVISNVPVVAMNVMGFGMLLIVLLYLVATRGNLMAVLPTIGLIAICVQRLLPSANRFSASIVAIRKYKPCVAIVHQATRVLLAAARRSDPKKPQLHVTFNHSLSLNNLSYAYPDAKHDTLSNITLTIKKNTTLGIVGESGAGKSTLVNVLLGLLPIERGQIMCDDADITRYENLALAKLVGYVPQQTFLLDGTIQENIAFGIPDKAIDTNALSKAIHVAQLEKFIEELPEGLNTRIGEAGVKLSGGQRQRLGIARALYNDPEILIMDEATNSLDSVTEKEFTESLQQLMQQKTIIIIAHRLSSVRICEKLIQLEKGQIVAEGSYHELAKSSDKFRRVYNISEVAW